MGITVENIRKTYGDFTALDGVSLEVREGELTALLGPSGSGKTTLLRIIAGLERPDPGSGAIRFHREDVADFRVQERRVGFVFQHYALFRHMTVFENVAFGLRVRPRRFRPSKRDTADRVHELLRLVQLDGMADRFPSQLSGGQRQRVALARALAVEPRVLLLDEPFGALDAGVRKQLRAWLRHLHEELQVTSVFVTHDQDEALEVADHVVIMDHGHIEQVGTPEDVFNHPATEFVMTFLGDVNVFHARVAGGKVSFASLQFDAPGTAADADARVFVRPHDLDLAREPGDAPSLPVLVTDVHAAGPTVRLRLQTPMGDRLTAVISQQRHRELGVQRGDRVHVAPRDLHVFCDPM